MTKSCPIMSFRDEHYEEIFCREEECAFWDEEKEQCCIKTMALASSVNSSDKLGLMAQAQYIPPSSYCQTDAISDTIIDHSYQRTRDIPIAPVLRERS